MDGGDSMSKTKQDDLMEDVEKIMEHLQNLVIVPSNTNRDQDRPQGMSQIRFTNALLFLHHYRSGKVFATVDDALGLEWATINDSDFNSLLQKDKHIANLEVGIVKQVYKATQKAAIKTANEMSTSPAPMSADGLVPAKLVRNQFDVVAESAYLCPKTGLDCKTDTWMYVAAASLGLQPDDRDALLRAVRGSKRKKTPSDSNNVSEKAMVEETKQPAKKRPPSTAQNTGLNRSPFNLLYMMEQKYIFDTKPFVYALPLMTSQEAKNWKGHPYLVIILCNDQEGKPGTAAIVAQRLGVTESVVSAADTDKLDLALDLLRSVVKFTAYCLDKKPPPPTSNGRTLWDSYKEKLANICSYSAVVDKQARDNSVPVPQLDMTGLLNKKIVKVDLRQENADVAQVVYPDPILLATKTSTNWTQKLGFQLVAEAEAPPEGLDDLSPIAKVISLQSMEDFSSYGSQSGPWE